MNFWQDNNDDFCARPTSSKQHTAHQQIPVSTFDHTNQQQYNELGLALEKQKNPDSHSRQRSRELEAPALHYELNQLWSCHWQSVWSAKHTQLAKGLEMLEPVFSREETIHCITHPKPITFGTHWILQQNLYLHCPALSDLSCKLWIQGHQVFTSWWKQTFGEAKTGLQSQSSGHWMPLREGYSEDKVKISFHPFTTSLARNQSVSVWLSTCILWGSETDCWPRDYNIAISFQTKGEKNLVAR